MELTVIVGHGGLDAVAKAGNDGHNPNHPVMVHEEIAKPRVRIDVRPQTDGYIYGRKPYIAAEAVKDTS